MNGEDCLVSIVIPVYRVEAYLEKCLDSVCKQSWQNLEVWIIDDESPDRSGQIADAYAKKDDRIKVIHIKNRGAAGARNVGLEYCSGDYIMFVDSDDWLEKRCVETLLRKLKESTCEIIQCQYYDEYKGRQVKHFMNEQEQVYTDQAFIKDMLHHWEDVLIWNKLFSKKVVSNIRFEEGHCIDDEFFTYRTIMQASRICVIPDCLYHYRQRQSGAMKSPEKRDQRLQDQLEFVIRRYNPLTEKYPEIKDEILIHMIEVFMYIMRESGSNRTIFDKSRQHLRKYGILALYQRKLTLQHKKSIIAYLLLPQSRLSGKGNTDKITGDIYYD